MNYFLLGIFFAAVFYPIASELTSVICSWLQVVNFKAQTIVAKINHEIELLQQEQADPCPIGFQLPEEYDDEYE